MTEEPFLYENYVVVDSDIPDFKDKIEQVLSNMSKTPEGREVIEEAYELNGRTRITIMGMEGGGSEAKFDEAEIVLSLRQLGSLQYFDVNGGMHDVSLDRALFHEFRHMRDPENLHPKSVRMAIMKPLVEEAMITIAEEHLGLISPTFEEASKALAEDMMSENPKVNFLSELNKFGAHKKPHENRTIQATNEYMARYFNEEPRSGHTGDSEGTPELEVRQLGPEFAQ